MNHTFYIQTDCLEAIKTLPIEKRNAMLGAIAGYQIDESIPEFENEMMVIFLIAKVFIDQRKRRSQSQRRNKSSAVKSKARRKSAHDSIKEIIEQSKLSDEQAPHEPDTPDTPETPKEITISAAPKATPEIKRNASTPTPNKKTRTSNDTKQSQETQLAIKKLTALCNKSRQKRR